MPSLAKIAKRFWGIPDIARMAEPLEPSTSEHRDEIIWLLGRWLDDIAALKKDHWTFAYSAMVALAAICVTLISRPGWLTWDHRWAAAGIAVLIFALWSTAHYATNVALHNARRGKDLAYSLLGKPVSLARPTTQANPATVPRMLALAVLTTTILTLIAALKGP